ncbi:MAG: RNase adapter RapZ [Mariprofundaceae bacterium]|nr:RNase adapter RapZ [Mariprofundaceae bacterium]
MGLIITGLSGSGKSTALHALEDVGCFCTDNLPLPLLADWAREMQQANKQMAVCVDVRSASPDALNRELGRLRKDNPGWQLLFLEADDAVLQRRFSTVRRRHPFAPRQDLPQAIAGERECMQQVRESANLILNTTAMNPYILADRVETFWRRQQVLRTDQEPNLTLTLMSFSYRCGIPPDADMVLDMRFLPNPHYEPGMASQTGRDAPVIEFLESHAEVGETKRRIEDWLQFVWPQMLRERKRYFTLAFGCSGGRHRSVYMACAMAEFARQNFDIEPLLRHRELTEQQLGTGGNKLT